MGLSSHTTSMAFGLQLANYRQLRDAVKFLGEHGSRTLDLPPALHPGIDYVAHVLDPDGHCLQLYFEMEQIGWDGKPRPKDLRRRINNTGGVWPETVDATNDTYRGDPYMGPWF